MEIDCPSVLGAFARDLRDDDLLECLLINRGRIGDELVGHARAIEIWRSLMRSRSFTAAVIETSSPGSGPRIIGFGASIFVQQRFIDEEFSHPRPGLNARVFASIDSGKSAVLSEPELRSGNTRGSLDSLVLYGSWRYDVLSPQGVHEVCACLGFSYLERHKGYNLDRLITQTVGQEERIASAASLVWRAFKHFDGPGQEASSLWVVTREDNLRLPANILNPLFIYKAPVFGFRDADQQLLLAAMSGLTDEELSAKLGLSLTGVKKRWISIFERTIDARPVLFPGLDRLGLDGNNGQKRGRQKRHHVLAYVRSHPEELRPFENETAHREASTTGG